MKIETPKKVSEKITPMTTEKHEHKFVPLWMPIAAFLLIMFAYIYCTLVGIEVNTYRAIGAIRISGLFALVCASLLKSE